MPGKYTSRPKSSYNLAFVKSKIATNQVNNFQKTELEFLQRWHDFGGDTNTFPLWNFSGLPRVELSLLFS